MQNNSHIATIPDLRRRDRSTSQRRRPQEPVQAEEAAEVDAAVKPSWQPSSSGRNNYQLQITLYEHTSGRFYKHGYDPS